MKSNKKRLTFVVVIVVVVAVVCILLAIGLRFVVTSGGALLGIPLSGGAAQETPAATDMIAITPEHLSDLGTFDSLSAVPPGLPPCKNILYPIVQGQSWTYRVMARGSTYLVDMRVPSTDGAQAVVDFSPQELGITTRAVVDCDNGGIHNLPWTGAWMLMDDLVNGSVTVEYVAGEFAPSHADFLAGDWNLVWSGEYRLNGSGSARFQGNDYALALEEAPLILNCQTVGSGEEAFELVVVPAGSFASALKVACTFETEASLSYNGLDLDGKVTGTMTQWFAPYVGMLKMQVDSATIRYLLVEIPVNVSGNVELIDYEQIP